MVNQVREVLVSLGVDGHLECVDGQVAAQRGRDLPADDPPREHVDDEGDIDPAAVGLDVGEIGNPEPVGTGRCEVPLDEVSGPRQTVVAQGRDLEGSAPSCSDQAHVAREALDGAASDADALLVQGDPDLAGAVDEVVLVVGGLDLVDQNLVSERSGGLRS